MQFVYLIASNNKSINTVCLNLLIFWKNKPFKSICLVNNKVCVYLRQRQISTFVTLFDNFQIYILISAKNYLIFLFDISQYNKSFGLNK